MAHERLSRSEKAYLHLTEEILRGRWNPGDTLSTYALAEELQISRTPVIEALKRLEAEGLVEIIPQVGCQVIRPSSSAVAELFALRGALEGLAAEAAAKNLDRATLTQLGVLLDELEAAAKRGDESAYDDLNYQFHMGIIEASGMPRLTQTAQGVWSLLRYQLARLPFMSEQMKESVAEHRAIYEALERRAGKRARAAAERHTSRCSERFVAFLERDAERGDEHDVERRDGRAARSDGRRTSGRRSRAAV